MAVVSFPGPLDPNYVSARDLAAALGSLLGSGALIYVDATNGSDGANGDTAQTAKATIQAGVDASNAGGSIIIAGPNVFDEAVVVPITKSGLSFINAGPSKSAAIQPAAANAIPMTVHADDCKAFGLDFASNGNGSAIRITGRRWMDYNCKFEGGLYQYVVGPGLVAYVNSPGDVSAGDETQNNGSDTWSYNGEFCWGTNGILLQGSDYGATTENHFIGPRFHNLTSSHFTEGHLAGGGNNLHYRNLDVQGGIHQASEDGSLPAKVYDLNDHANNNGTVTGCVLPVALNVGANPGQSLVSANLKWIGNLHPAGLSTAQPS